MRRLLLFFALMFVATPIQVAQAAEGETASQQEAFFEKQIRPLLAQSCWECHGEKKQESDLRLDLPAGLKKGGATGEALLDAKQPEHSFLLRVVRHEGDIHMPPKTKLSPEQIAHLETWVKQGAPWPASSSAPPAILSAQERVDVHRKEHWAYQPIRNPPVPAVKQADWCRNDVDRYILAQLEAKHLAPSPEADRRTLMRRLYFDLLGLPPSPQEVKAFETDDRPEAYEELVDRLLQSPHYGERWGRHWLDVARYADSRGYNFEGDRRYPYAYTYRDYVIEAFNRDLPWDRFLTEQLAADQLDLGEDRRPLAALGFITVGRKFLNINDTYDDQIDLVSRGLLGLTLACARCHDHKYDAIPMDDYYALYGVFASCKEPDAAKLPIVGDPNMVPGYEAFQKKLLELEDDRNKFLQQKVASIEDDARNHVTSYLAYVLVDGKAEALADFPFVKLKPDDFRKRITDRWRDYFRDRAKPDDATLGLWAEIAKLGDENFPAKADELLNAFRARKPGLRPGEINPALLARIQELKLTRKTELALVYGDLLQKAWEAWKVVGINDDTLERISEELRPLARMIVGKESPTQFNEETIASAFKRDEANKMRDLQKKIDAHQANSDAAPPRAMVLEEKPQPHDPRIFIRGDQHRPGKPVSRHYPVVLTAGAQKVLTTRGGRLDLAREIVSPDNPLTRRVLVNRVWMHHFGEPFVDTPSDFGIRTPRPVQAELLDHLSDYLLQQGWSLKQLHRYLVNSATYRQQSAQRADCAAVDPENRLLWKMNRRRLEWEPLRDTLLAVSGRLDPKLGGRSVAQHDASSTRRTVYAMLDRQDVPNLYRMFDIASPDSSSPKRPRTTIPQQSLFLMNSPFMAEQAIALADRAIGNTSEEKIQSLFGFAYQRTANEQELQACVQFVNQPPEQEAKLNSWQQLAQILLMSNELAYID